MKKHIYMIVFAAVLLKQEVIPQSSVVFEAGTAIEATAGADICADHIEINGIYSGAGTQCDSPLPVELAALSVISDRTAVTVRWETATEMDNYGFEVERKSAVAGAVYKTDWTTVGFINGHGTSNVRKSYFFVDQNVLPGRHTYRLKQIDRSGGFSYSAEAEVTHGQVPKVFMLDQNYPNPFNPVTSIGFTLKESGFTTLTIYDAVGRETAVLVNDVLAAGIRYTVVFNAGGLASGTYVARLKSGNDVRSLRMLLVK